MEMKTVRLIVASIAAVGLWSAGALSRAQNAAPAAADPNASMTNASTGVQSAVENWPQTSKKAALALVEKYGQPDIVADDKLTWNDKHEWASIVACRESSINAGAGHDDFIMSTVRYKVPADKFDSVKKFDKSLSIDTEKGTVTASGGDEEANILALNLVDEIATGRHDVSWAKSFRRKTERTTMAGKSSEYTQQLMFTPDPKSSSDAAVPAAGGQGAEPATEGADAQPKPEASPETKTPPASPPQPY